MRANTLKTIKDQKKKKFDNTYMHVKTKKIFIVITNYKVGIK